MLCFFTNKESKPIRQVPSITTIAYQEPQKPTVKTFKQIEKVTEQPAPEDQLEEPRISELDLSLELVEVIPPSNREALNIYGGELRVSGYSIDYLILNMDDHFEISFASLNGNTFEYQVNGETYSGMLYQVDQDSYMVTLTNGLLEAYRLRFISKKDDYSVAQEEYNNNEEDYYHRGYYE